MQRQSVEETNQTKGRAHALGTVVGTCPNRRGARALPSCTRKWWGGWGWCKRLAAETALFKRERAAAAVAAVLPPLLRARLRGLLPSVAAAIVNGAPWRCSTARRGLLRGRLLAAAREAAARAGLFLWRTDAAALLPS